VERVLGRHWVMSLLVLAPIITVCLAIVAAVTLATVAAIAILAVVVPHRLAAALRRFEAPRVD
jgi:hypothetical protein